MVRDCKRKLFGKNGGSIINIGTAGTQNPGPSMVLYLSTKGSLDIMAAWRLKRRR